MPSATGLAQFLPWDREVLWAVPLPLCRTSGALVGAAAPGARGAHACARARAICNCEMGTFLHSTNSAPHICLGERQLAQQRDWDFNGWGALVLYSLLFFKKGVILFLEGDPLMA